jgi:predicted DNA binding CopG/RHH family protein
MSKPEKLVEVHARFFAEDIDAVKKIAQEKGLKWQIELRVTLRRALREVHLLK